jgi:hypothetical protein
MSRFGGGLEVMVQSSVDGVDGLLRWRVGWGGRLTSVLSSNVGSGRLWPAIR